MNSFMSGVVMIGGVVVAAIGGYQLSGAMSEPFDYKSATHEARVAYLQDEAQPIAKGMKRALINPSGVGPSFKLAEIEVYPDSRKINFEIRVSGKIASGQQFRNVKYAMLERVCGKYASTGLSKNNIAIVQDFVDHKKRSQGRITISNSACKSYL